MSTFAIIFLLVQPVGAVQVQPKTQADWTCIDYSIDYAKQNPEWGIVTISNNQWFRGVTHAVNYQITEQGNLKIHDGLYDRNYVLYDWQNIQFYHFWISGTPSRNYKVLQDNSYIYE
jgi:hypothetical protein